VELGHSEKTGLDAFFSAEYLFQI